MEQPLAAQRNRTRNDEYPNPGMQQQGGPISPGSDALGREVKKFGHAGPPPNNAYESVNKKQADIQYKSKFLRQYEDSHAPVHSSPPPASNPQNNQNAQGNRGKQQVDPDEDFMNILRADDRSSGPGWNNDTTTSGFAPPSKTKSKPSRPAVQQATKAAQQQKQQYEQDEYNYEAVRPPRASPRASSGGNVGHDGLPPARVSPRDPEVSQARSKLSLLKSKIRQSEGGGSSNNLTATMNSNGSAPRMSNFRNTNNSNMEMDSPYPYEPSPAPSSNSRNNGGRNNRNSFDEDEGDVMVPVPKNRVMLNKRNDGGNQQQQQQQQQYQSNNPPVQQKVPPRHQAQQQQKQYQQQQNYDYQQEEQENYNSRNHNAGGSSSSYGGYSAPFEDEGPEEMNNADMPQHQCPDCLRSFNPIPFQKHIKICAKVFLQKRKAFDSAKMRVADNEELVKILKQKEREEKKAQMQAKKQQKNAPAAVEDQSAQAQADKAAKWKEQSKAFRAAMRAAREVSKAQANGDPLPPPMPSAPDPSLVLCPHCGRRFNEKAAERHIPQCQNIKAKPTSLRRGTGINSANGVAVASNKKGKGRF